MKTPNREQVQELVEKLADKTLSFGCRVYCRKDLKTRIIINDKTKGQWWLELESPSYKERFPKYLIQTKEGTLGLGDGEYADYTSRIEILGHPILIGDIAKRIAWKYNDEEFGTDFLTVHDFSHSEVPKLFELWGACEKRNENLSLQSIIEDSGWGMSVDGKGFAVNRFGEPVEVLKSESARNLVEFIYNLNL